MHNVTVTESNTVSAYGGNHRRSGKLAATFWALRKRTTAQTVNAAATIAIAVQSPARLPHHVPRNGTFHHPCNKYTVLIALAVPSAAFQRFTHSISPAKTAGATS